LRTLFDVQNLL